jgi:hypothetical protein
LVMGVFILAAFLRLSNMNARLKSAARLGQKRTAY